MGNSPFLFQYIMTAEKEQPTEKFLLIGVIQNRSKDTKGNPGLSGIHLFWIEFPAAILFSAGRRNGSGLYFGCGR